MKRMLVVCPHPENDSWIIQDGENGFLVSDQKEWKDRLLDTAFSGRESSRDRAPDR